LELTGRTEQRNTDPGAVGVAKTVTFDAHPRSSLIVALDFDSLSSAVKFAKQVAILSACSKSAASCSPPRVLP